MPSHSRPQPAPQGGDAAQIQQVAQEVLAEAAAAAEGLSQLSDAERLVWMLGRAFDKGGRIARNP